MMDRSMARMATVATPARAPALPGRSWRWQTVGAIGSLLVVGLGVLTAVAVRSLLNRP
jgi:hypothetical protein